MHCGRSRAGRDAIQSNGDIMQGYGHHKDRWVPNVPGASGDRDPTLTSAQMRWRASKLPGANANAGALTAEITHVNLYGPTRVFPTSPRRFPPKPSSLQPRSNNSDSKAVERPAHHDAEELRAQCASGENIPRTCPGTTTSVSG